MNLRLKLDERWYGGYERNWDDRFFRERILAVAAGKIILDVGAGAGIVEAMNFRGLAASVCGIDPDPRVATNPYLDEGRIGFGDKVPYPAATFDTVFSDNVLEHLDVPSAVFAEVARVLKPGGHFLAKTPNAWHYMPLIARLTPHRFHRWFNRLRGRDGENTFPTRYRANTPGEIRRLAASAGLEVVTIELIEGRPEYLRFSAITYVFGACYERLVNRFDSLAAFRILLIVHLRKVA